MTIAAGELFLIKSTRPQSCAGCRHEFVIKDGELRCDLGEKYGIRCTKWSKQ